MPRAVQPSAARPASPLFPAAQLRTRQSWHGLKRPDNARARNNLGKALLKRGRAEEAAVHFAEAVRLHAGFPVARRNLGLVLLQLGRNKEAIAQSSEAIRLDPGSWDAHHELGVALYREGQIDDAVVQYREALRLKSDLPAVNFRLGFLLYEDGDYIPAAECFRQELALNPAYSDANLFLGQTLRNLGREEEAIVHLRKAIALDTRSELAYKALVAALSEKGDLSDAVEVLRIAEKEFPADPSFPAQLARVLTRLNREEEALKEMEKFRGLKQSEKQ